MTRNNKLRALMAATIYASIHHRSNPLDSPVQVMLEAIDEADQLLKLTQPEAPEAEAPAPPSLDPYFVIHAETCRAISSPTDESPDRPEQWINNGNRALYEAIDQIDAGMFSGDGFQSLEAIRYLEWFIGRWVRELKLTRNGLASEAPGATPPRVYPQTYEKKCGICHSAEHGSDTCPEDIPF